MIYFDQLPNAKLYKKKFTKIRIWEYENIPKYLIIYKLDKNGILINLCINAFNNNMVVIN